VKAADVIAMAKENFGKLAPRALPDRKPQVEPEQLGAKRLEVKAPAKLPYLLMGWKAPTLKDWEKDSEPYALQILAGVLSGNDSARLSKALVKTTPIAASASAGYDAVSRGPGMFLIDASPLAGKTVAELEAAIRKELARVQKDGVTEAELKRVKAQVIAGEVYQLDSLFYQAMQLGEYAIAGMPTAALQGRAAKLRAVTADEVKAVAQKYLIDDRLTVATLDPQPLDAKPKRAKVEGVRHVQ
jgi:zinc protease